jgi:hypothetical protein
VGWGVDGSLEMGQVAGVGNCDGCSCGRQWMMSKIGDGSKCLSGKDRIAYFDGEDPFVDCDDYYPIADFFDDRIGNFVDDPFEYFFVVPFDDVPQSAPLHHPKPN